MLSNKEKIAVYIPTPGIGDLIVRIPALNLLSEYFDIDLYISLPDKIILYFSKHFPSNINVISISNFYVKTKYLKFLSIINDIYRVLIFRKYKKYKIFILMSDLNTNLGILRLLFKIFFNFKFSIGYSITSQGIFNLPKFKKFKHNSIKFWVSICNKTAILINKKI